MRASSCHEFPKSNPVALFFTDRKLGTQYRSAIFYHTPEQLVIAEEVKQEIQQLHYPQTPIVTDIAPATEFWKAEPYHQEYLINNPGGYCNHRLRW